MCEHCHRSPHLPGCPNEPEPPHVYICSGCGASIVDGEDFYRIMGEPFCEECIQNAKEEAVYDETYES